MGTTLIFLTVLGILTVFWEPLTAFAVGTPSGSEPAAESHASTVDAGEAATTPADGSSNS